MFGSFQRPIQRATRHYRDTDQARQTRTRLVLIRREKVESQVHNTEQSRSPQPAGRTQEEFSAVAKITTKRRFPVTERIGDDEITFRLMDSSDKAALQDFANSLSKDEMMFLRMDIANSEVLDEWFKNIDDGHTLTVVAYHGDSIAGYCSLHSNTRTWTSHIGELRVFVGEQYRGSGLSKRLLSEVFQIGRELKLERLVMNLAREQARFRKFLEEMGFQAEALLTDWLKSRDGRTHDLVIMSHSLVDGE
jgi:L-amino acid N-acyltransferase YncA